MSDADELLLQALTHEHWLCPVCGYDLHLTTAPRCSDCGHAIELRVMPAQVLAKTWLATLLLSAGQTGMGIFILTLSISTHGLPRSLLFPKGIIWDVFFYASLITIPFPLIILAMRRKYSRLPTWFQRSCLLFFAAILVPTLIGMLIAIR